MDQKTVLITGASSGIGKELAKQFAQNNYHIIAVSENEEELARASSEIVSLTNASITTIVQDLTEESAAQNIYDDLRRRSITVDVLVNDAGVGQRGLFHETDLERELHLIQLNIVALTKMTKLFLRDMVERNQGKILNLGSVAGFQPGPLLAVYHATKAYVISFSEAIAEELKNTNVTVTTLCPGPTDTDFFEKADAENVQILEKGIVMEPSEVARIGYEALMNGEHTVIPGFSNKVMTFTRRLIPKSLQAQLNKQYYKIDEE